MKCHLHWESAGIAGSSNFQLQNRSGDCTRSFDCPDPLKAPVNSNFPTMAPLFQISKYTEKLDRDEKEQDSGYTDVKTSLIQL